MEIICRTVLSVQFTSFLSVACQMSQDCSKYVCGWGSVWGYRKNRVAFKRKRQPLPWHHRRWFFLTVLSQSLMLLFSRPHLRWYSSGRLHSWKFSVRILNSYSHYLERVNIRGVQEEHLIFSLLSFHSWSVGFFFTALEWNPWPVSQTTLLIPLR